MHRRNWFIDNLKGISCILVVFLHCQFPGMFGKIMESLMVLIRLVVLLFDFCVFKKSKQKYSNYIFYTSCDWIFFENYNFSAKPI